MCVCIFVYIDICIPPTWPGTCGGQKTVSDPLELELQIALDYHVHSGN